MAKKANGMDPSMDPEEYKQIIKKRKREKRRYRHRIFLTVLLVFMVSIEAVVGYFAYQYLQSNLEGLPIVHPKDFISEESSKIYDGRGNQLTEIGTYYRENIDYNDCPESLVDAFLAIEDSRYFSHNGFDIPRFTKAIIETLVNGNRQGGSTFTMQLVKNTYFSRESGSEQVEYDADNKYKIQQIWLSMQLEQMLDKKDIFILYVNKLNFGDRIRGVEKAAQFYFNKHASELNLSESAMLAGIVNLPNLYNPYNYLEEAIDRRNEVLYLMLTHGYIKEEEYHLAKSIKIENQLIGEDHLDVENSQFSAYVDVVIQEAQQMTGYDPVLKGMRIETALIPEIQERIEAISNEQTRVSFPDPLMQVAIVSLNNQTGEIVGLSGGRNYQGGARLLNRATQGYKQPGSSVKPFLDYALAFEYLGYSLDEVVMDRPITFPGESRVLVNADGEYRGELPLRNAVATSLNIPAILTLEKVTAVLGSTGVVNYLHSVGLSKANEADYHMSYAIGGNQLITTVKEMAGAHGAMINLGIYNQPHTINKITFSDGTEIYPEHQNERVLSSGSAYLTDQLMQYDVDSQIYNYMHVLKRRYPVYAKTGTTDWGSDGLQYGIPAGAAKDKWMIASTSQYTNAVWIGYDMAVKNQGTYFPLWKSELNIPGRINNLLLDIEEEVSPDTIGGVERPEDVVDVRYVYGSYPHVNYESWMSNPINSLVSATGLEHVPTVYYSDYNSGLPELTGFSASVANGLFYANWYTEDGCAGDEQDISLHDYWNDVEEKGACLANITWIADSLNNVYVADLYQDDVYLTTITSNTNSYAGFPIVFHGEIKACGYYRNGRGTSETKCTSAGYFDPDAVKEENGQ